VVDIVAENMQLGSRAQGMGGGAPRPAAPAQRPSAPANHAAPVEEEIPTINLDDERDEIKIEDVPF
jgi:hypothetical protein